MFHFVFMLLQMVPTRVANGAHPLGPTSCSGLGANAQHMGKQAVPWVSGAERCEGGGCLISVGPTTVNL
jgi:hypothetical protein